MVKKFEDMITRFDSIQDGNTMLGER